MPDERSPVADERRQSVAPSDERSPVADERRQSVAMPDECSLVADEPRQPAAMPDAWLPGARRVTPCRWDALPHGLEPPAAKQAPNVRHGLAPQTPVVRPDGTPLPGGALAAMPLPDAPQTWPTPPHP